MYVYTSLLETLNFENLTPRNAVRDVASEAIACGQTVFSSECVSPARSHAISWMKDVGMLCQGHVIPQFTTLKTVFKQPVLHSSCDSRFSIRKWLEDQGWTVLESATGASVDEKCFNSGAPLEYFLLLRYHLDALTRYDQKYGLRHSQSKGYYDALLACFKASVVTDLEGQYVAHAQKLEFYKGLKDFFSGQGGVGCGVGAFEF